MADKEITSQVVVVEDGSEQFKALTRPSTLVNAANYVFYGPLLEGEIDEPCPEATAATNPEAGPSGGSICRIPSIAAPGDLPVQSERARNYGCDSVTE